MKNLLLVVIALCVVAGVFGFYFYQTEIVPLDEEADTLNREIKNLEKTASDLRNIDREIDSLNEELKKLIEERSKKKTEFNQLSTVVPKLLASTETIANKFRVKFQDIRISPLVRNEECSELPVELIVQGTFQDIGSFLKIMEARKIVNLADGQISVNVTSGTDVKSKSKSPNLNVTLVAKVYIMDNI